MAGGAYIVRTGANGEAAPSKFNGRLPGSGGGVKQSNRIGSTGAAVVYDKETQDAIFAGYMPAALMAGDGSSVRYDVDPVHYVQVAGIRPRSQTDVEALQKYPELALHLLNEAGRANSMAKATVGYVAGTAIHASLGSNAPADAKASATFVPNGRW
ncbi:hypothetical protein P3T43_002374 [Paraburkholderia sp. GAS41]|uniref:hypothetical protein n=1 Tax=Paraburkholderia sp. GAS41 TaxID=3035134 RepID=UPI003D212F20